MGHILRRNCLLKQVIEGKIKGQIEVTRRQGRRCKKLLGDLKDRRGYCELKEEAVDRTMWRNCFARGFGPVVWQITDENEIVSVCLQLLVSSTQSACANIFSHSLIKVTIFEIKVNEHNSFYFLYKFCLQYLLLQEELTEIRSKCPHVGLHVACRCSYSVWMKLEFSQQFFEKMFKCRISWKFV